VSRPDPATRRLAEIVLLAMAAEFVWLWSRRGFAPQAATGPLVAIGPGACLALATRAAAARSGWGLTAAAFAAALPFHLADLARRPLR